MDKRTAEQAYIIKDPERDISQDYGQLRQEGLQHIEKLASELWTDYNIHDPGITLLELLCYAITDLGYRTGQDIRDILSEEIKGENQIRGQFHKAQDIFSCEPVTFNDLRKRLIDIDGIRNAWIEKHDSIGFCVNESSGILQDCTSPSRHLNGVYDVFIEFEEWIESDTQKNGIINDNQGVKDVLLKHRNLCEDFINICELDNEHIAVCADLEVKPGADLEATLAEIYYRIDTFISPEIRFYSIEEMLQKGKTTDDIFAGPTLQHGFIDDEELQKIERQCSIAVSDIIQIIMDVPGLVSVKDISLLSYGEQCEPPPPGESTPRPRQEKWLLQLDTDKFRTPVLCTLFSRITFYKNGLPYFANQAVVEALLKEKKAGTRHSGTTAQNRQLPEPVGKDRKLSDYYPVQNELPATYRTGMVRVPRSASDKRKAQSRQLKAYLMFFEQLLANYLAQLDHIHELFSWDSGLKQSYFSQRVTGISDIDELYQDYAHLESELNQIIETPEQALQRKGKFLDHLMARFCESFTDYSLLMFNQEGETNARHRIIEDQQRLLENYPEVSGQRGQAHDYRFPDNQDNLSGFQKRIYHLLGFDEVERSNFCQDVLTIEEEDAQWRFVIRHEDQVLFSSIFCEKKDSIETLLDLALSLGDCSNNYRLNTDETRYELILTCGEEVEPTAIGQTTTLEDLETVLGLFQQLGNIEGFHLIEHILLRRRSTASGFMPIQLNPPGACECVEVRDPYSFRFTVILPAWSRRFRDMRFRHFVEQTLRLEAPAHTLTRICWLNYSQMQDVEADYNQWARQLAEQKSNLGKCGETDFSGQYPLNDTANATYEQALENLVNTLHSLTSVYPIARLHDCQHTDTEAPPVSLDNTILGTF